MVEHLAVNLIAEGELFRCNDTNRKPIVIILYKLLLVMLWAAVRKAAISQVNQLMAR